MRTPIPFVGPAYQAASLNLNAQRCVNWYIEMGGEGAAAPIALLPTPGLTRVLEMPNAPAPIRGMKPFKGDLWVVSGEKVFRVTPQWVATLVGALATSSGPVSMAINETQIALVDGVLGYYYDLPSSTFGTITDAEFPTGARQISYLKNRFLVEAPQSQSMSWSKIGDVRDWNGLDFASTDASPDNIVAHLPDQQELYVFGETTTQMLVADAGGFSPSQNTAMQQGCVAAFSPVNIDNSVMWLGRGDEGEGVVWQSRGGAAPLRVSTHGVETAISRYARVDDAIGFAYQQRGHLFYQLTFPAAMATWVYDVASQQWHERGYMVPSTGEFTRHRANCHALFGGKHVVGDWERGHLYFLDPENYTDDGDTLKRLRASQTVVDKLNDLPMGALVVYIEAGVGTSTGQGQKPAMIMRKSKDGGHTWSNRRTASMGRIGQYDHGARFNRPGNGRQVVYEISVTDPVKAVVLGAFLGDD
ncbi:hypothetical protein D3C87_518750 [compost metagenome]